MQITAGSYVDLKFRVWNLVYMDILSIQRELMDRQMCVVFMFELAVIELNEQVKIDVVEIDEAIVSVATDWFGFTADDRLTVSVADGLEYIKQLNRTGD